ncbi:MAG: hypothetical protein ACRDFS_02040 [Chloroflexota bacterium]
MKKSQTEPLEPPFTGDERELMGFIHGLGYCLMRKKDIWRDLRVEGYLDEYGEARLQFLLYTALSTFPDEHATKEEWLVAAGIEPAE